LLAKFAAVFATPEGADLAQSANSSTLRATPLILLLLESALTSATRASVLGKTAAGTPTGRMTFDSTKMDVAKSIPMRSVVTTNVDAVRVGRNVRDNTQRRRRVLSRMKCATTICKDTADGAAIAGANTRENPVL